MPGFEETSDPWFPSREAAACELTWAGHCKRQWGVTFLPSHAALRLQLLQLPQAAHCTHCPSDFVHGDSSLHTMQLQVSCTTHWSSTLSHHLTPAVLAHHPLRPEAREHLTVPAQQVIAFLVLWYGCHAKLCRCLLPLLVDIECAFCLSAPTGKQGQPIRGGKRWMPWFVLAAACLLGLACDMSQTYHSKKTR